MGINHRTGDIPVGNIELLFKQFLSTFLIKLRTLFIFVCFGYVAVTGFKPMIPTPKIDVLSLHYTADFKTKVSILTNRYPNTLEIITITLCLNTMQIYNIFLKYKILLHFFLLIFSYFLYFINQILHIFRNFMVANIYF